jgi:hypothetical protein
MWSYFLWKSWCGLALLFRYTFLLPLQGIKNKTDRDGTAGFFYIGLAFTIIVALASHLVTHSWGGFVLPLYLWVFMVVTRLLFILYGLLVTGSNMLGEGIEEIKLKAKIYELWRERELQHKSQAIQRPEETGLLSLPTHQDGSLTICKESHGDH